MPRRYSLGKRAAQVDATRARIVAAAADLYRLRGATHTTVAQVAEAADVAPGTVRNHFPSTEDLARAVAAHVMAELRMPGPETFDGLTTTSQRVAALARAMAAYYERSQPWYRMGQLDEHPLDAWVEARTRYEAEFDALISEALGPLAGDADAVAVIAALIDPAFFAVLWGRGLTTEQATDLVGRVLGAWLENRDAAT